jgi:hypothetical protein
MLIADFKSACGKGGKPALGAGRGSGEDSHPLIGARGVGFKVLNAPYHEPAFDVSKQKAVAIDNLSSAFV